MKYKEIANRITGFSCPVFGISWNPPELEISIARRVLTYLEDKRVLYNPYELEMIDHCQKSVIQIRDFLTKELLNINEAGELGKIIRGMRTACRKFLDGTQKSYFRKEIEKGVISGMGMTMEFYSGIGELRGTIGALIGKLVVMYGIDCESQLMKIIPIEESK